MNKQEKRMQTNLFIRSIWIDWEKIGQDSYLREIPALQFREPLCFHKNVTFFVGENGTGKSTLLEGIAVAYGFNPEGGTRNYNFSTYDSHSELFHAMKLSKGTKRPAGSYFLRAESFYNVASKAEDYRDGERPDVYYAKYGGKSFHQQSHGESFLALIQGSFVENGIYILDEPEAALSVASASAHTFTGNRQAFESRRTVSYSQSLADLIGTSGSRHFDF